jgi:DNA-3-methyladenine glycosylase II
MRGAAASEDLQWSERPGAAAQGGGAGQLQRTVLQLVGPFDLALSLEAAAIFYPRDGPLPRTLRLAVRAEAGLAILEISQVGQDPARLGVRLSRGDGGPQIRSLAGRVICADLDLRPFYRLALGDPVLAPVTAALAGLKPLQPATVFEAAVIAITEQQLSMAAAYRIRSRLIHRLGEQAEGVWQFPGPDRFADAPASHLAACGLSRQKIGYLTALARSILAGELDLESMRRDTDAEIRVRLLAMPGFGRWSVEHLLLHGFGRPGALPSTDVSLQKVVGRYLAHGQRLTADELERALSPFRPYDGLAAYYLSVAYRHHDEAKLPRDERAKP